MGSITGLKTPAADCPLKVPFAIQHTTTDPKFTPNKDAIAAFAIQGVAQSQLKGAVSPESTNALTALFGKKKRK